MNMNKDIFRLKQLAGLISEDVEWDDDETQEEKDARAKKMEDDDTDAENAEREDLDEWHPDKEWDEEGDEEDNGQDYPSDEDLFGMSEDADYESTSGDTAAMGDTSSMNIDEDGEKRTLEQKERIGEKLQYAIEDYLEDLGLRELSSEERPKFQKGLGRTQTTVPDTFINKLSTSFHYMTPEDDPKRSDPRHNDQEVHYSLRIYNPNERFNLSTLRGFITQAKKEAKSQGFKFFDTLRRSNQDILLVVVIR